MVRLRKTVTDPRLRGFTHDCDTPRCTGILHSTGRMWYDEVFGRWLVELVCSKDQLKNRLWRAEWQPIIDEVLKEHPWESISAEPSW